MRKYLKLTKEEFEQKIIEKYSKRPHWEYDDDFETFKRDGAFGKNIQYILQGSDIMSDIPIGDWNIDFDTENLGCDEAYGDYDQDLMGIKQINDFVYCGCAAGGDWEYPVYFILYFDEQEKIRMYIPKKGNCFDKKDKIAYGNEDDEDEEEESEHIPDSLLIEESIKNRFNLNQEDCSKDKLDKR